MLEKRWGGGTKWCFVVEPIGERMVRPRASTVYTIGGYLFTTTGEDLRPQLGLRGEKHAQKIERGLETIKDLDERAMPSTKGTFFWVGGFVVWNPEKKRAEPTGTKIKIEKKRGSIDVKCSAKERLGGSSGRSKKNRKRDSGLIGERRETSVTKEVALVPGPGHPS